MLTGMIRPSKPAFFSSSVSMSYLFVFNCRSPCRRTVRRDAEIRIRRFSENISRRAPIRLAEPLLITSKNTIYFANGQLLGVKIQSLDMSSDRNPPFSAGFSRSERIRHPPPTGGRGKPALHRPAKRRIPVRRSCDCAEDFVVFYSKVTTKK